MNRRQFLAAAPAVLAACGRGSDAPGDGVTLKMVYSSAVVVAAAPLYLAEERGYFRDEGIHLETQTAATVAAFVQMLASGVVDIALPALTPGLVNGAVREAGVKVVYAREQPSERCGGAGQLVARRAAFPGGLRDTRELRGRKVAILNEGGAMDFTLGLALEAAGLRRDEVEIVSLRPAESMAALQAGQIDAAVLGMITGLPANLRELLLTDNSFARVFPGQQTAFVAYGQRLLGADRALGVRFLRAWARAQREYVDGATPRYLETWARENGVDPAQVITPCRENFARDGRIDLPSLQRYADWLRRRGLAEGAVQAEDLADTRILEEARGA